MSNFFDEEEDNYSEYELLQQTAKEVEYYEPTPVESTFDLNEREESVVSEAIVRLEQARLYEMLIKHDMFDGVDANPRALRNVKNELKQYIVERLEILLGIRTEEKTESVTIQSPFNENETAFLKMLAKKGSEKFTTPPIQPKTEPNKIKPMSPPPRQELKTMRTEVKPEPLKSNKEPVRPMKTSQPIQKREAVATNENKTEMQLAKEDLINLKNRKPAYEMNEDELIEQAKKMKTRYKKSGIPDNALAQPVNGQMEMVYAARAARAPKNDIGATIGQLIAASKIGE